MISMFFAMLAESINIVFVGHLNDPAKLAGVGMGNMMINMFGLSPVYGMNGALETLVAHAFGNGNLHLCGVYLNWARFVLTLLYLPILVILLLTERILILIGTDPLISHYAGTYVIMIFPGVFLLG